MANPNKNAQARIRNTLIKSGSIAPAPVFAWTGSGPKTKKTPEQVIAERRALLAGKGK